MNASLTYRVLSASFESMRKEQHKAFQENQKPEKSKDKFDFTELLEDSKDDKRLLNRTNELDKTVIQPMPTNELDKPLHPSQAPVPRPLVPPGFSSMIAEKSTGTKSLTNPLPSEVILLYFSSNICALKTWLVRMLFIYILFAMLFLTSSPQALPSTWGVSFTMFS